MIGQRPPGVDLPLWPFLESQLRLVGGRINLLEQKSDLRYKEFLAHQEANQAGWRKFERYQQHMNETTDNLTLYYTSTAKLANTNAAQLQTVKGAGAQLQNRVTLVENRQDAQETVQQRILALLEEGGLPPP